MTHVAGTWIARPGTAAVFDMLEGAGHRALFVGGCVRDALACRAVSDIDIATDARPEATLALAAAAGLRAVPTGIDHGTVTIVSGGLSHEVTTFRRDIETDGRHAVVAFSDRVEDDAIRRDFTMNALYADRSGTVLDPVGTGIADLRAGRVRFIGDASARIGEDYLRILRFFRFHATHGSAGAGLDPEALAAISANIAGLQSLSAERVGHEITRLLAAQDPAPAVAAMVRTGVLARVLPGADDGALAPLVALEETDGTAPDPLRRLAVLGGEDAAARLRLSRAVTRGLSLRRDLAGGTVPIHEIAYRHGKAVARDVAFMRAALLGGPLDEGLLADAAAGAAARFPVAAADLMPALQGEDLGRRLRALEDRWIASRFTLSRTALLED